MYTLQAHFLLFAQCPPLFCDPGVCCVWIIAVCFTPAVPLFSRGTLANQVTGRHPSTVHPPSLQL